MCSIRRCHSERRRSPLIVLVAALCVWPVACGGHGAPGLRPRHAGVASQPGPSSAVNIPRLRYLSGDYDGDDYYANRGDADNDDSHILKDRDNDADSKNHSYYDADDGMVRSFGRAASAVDRGAIMALVRRYYSAAAAEDGRAGCSMLLGSVARSIPQTLGRPPGPPYLAGSACGAIVTKVFEQDHRQLAIYAKRLHVADVRVAGDHGVVVLDVRPLPARQILVKREGDVWKVDTLLDNELP